LPVKNVVLACRILEDEILAALKNTGCGAPVIWLEASLHLHPKKLKSALQTRIDELGNVDNILLTFGLCGNSVIGLRSAEACLIIPHCNDCIEMLLKYPHAGLPERETKGCYFLTRGWVKGEHSLAREVDHYFARYGQARARRILKTMLGQYRHLVVLDTKSYPLEDFLPIAGELAAKLDLELKVYEASTSQLERLFAGLWDDAFRVIPPGMAVTFEHFYPMPGVGGLVNQLCGGTAATGSSF